MKAATHEDRCAQHQHHPFDGASERRAFTTLEKMLRAIAETLGLRTRDVRMDSTCFERAFFALLKSLACVNSRSPDAGLSDARGHHAHSARMAGGKPRGARPAHADCLRRTANARVEATGARTTP